MKNKLDYNFKLHDFEGPLDLLLHLVKKKKMDIFDINLMELTDQYLEFINNHMNYELDVMSEYLVIAAYLIELKSKTLLPKQKVSFIDDNYEAEQKARLIASLLEYEQYKQASHKMGLLEENRMKQFEKESLPLPESKKIINEIFDINSLSEQKLMRAAMKMIERLKNEKPIESKIQIRRISIEERTTEIKKIFDKEIDKEINFIDLFNNYENVYIAITFLAILDLARLGNIRLVQHDYLEDIFVKWIGGEYNET